MGKGGPKPYQSHGNCVYLLANTDLLYYIVRLTQVMWEVLGLLVRHQGRLKSSAPPSKKDDTSAEAQLATVLVSRSSA